MDMAVDENGSIYLAYENALSNKPNEIHVLSSDGKVSGKTEVDYYPSFIKANDDSVHVMTIQEDESTKIDKINSDGKMSVSPFQNVADEISFDYIIDGGNGYSFYSLGEKGIMAYDDTAGELQLLASYDDLSVSLDYLETVIPLSEKTLCIVSINQDYRERYFNIFHIK